jgi:hypothetical protein
VIFRITAFKISPFCNSTGERNCHFCSFDFKLLDLLQKDAVKKKVFFWYFTRVENFVVYCKNIMKNKFCIFKCVFDVWLITLYIINLSAKIPGANEIVFKLNVCNMPPIRF